jgi:hypothetical protein
VPKRVTLVALWAAFAVASVSVGFAAASLVSDPFTDVRADVTGTSGAGDAPFTDNVTTPDAQATETPTSTPTAKAGHTHTPKPTGSAATRTTRPATAPAAATVKGGIPTRGGYVSGTCRSGLVSVGAAPAIYWRVASYTQAWLHTARVRLVPSKNANGEQVEVTVSCSAGKPGFLPVYHPGDGGGDDGGGGSGGDDGGSGGGDDSGGSDGSSGAGDG